MWQEKPGGCQGGAPNDSCPQQPVTPGSRPRLEPGCVLLTQSWVAPKDSPKVITQEVISHLPTGMYISEHQMRL